MSGGGEYHFAATYYMPRSMGGDTVRPWCHAKRPGYGSDRMSDDWTRVSCANCLAMRDGAPAPEMRFSAGGAKPRADGIIREARRLRPYRMRPRPAPPPPAQIPAGPLVPSMDDIAQEVARAYGLSLNALRSKSRQQEIVFPRQEAMWRMRNARREDGSLVYSCVRVASFFDFQDHTTVLHACKAVEARWAAMAKAA